MLKYFIKLLFLCMLALQVSGAEAKQPSACLAGKLSSLKKGGFSGPLLCDHNGVEFRSIGQVRGGNWNYFVYDYRYRFKPKDGAVLHGGQRLIVFDSQGSYLGQYALSPPPNLDVIIEGSQVKISASGQLKGAIEFATGPAPEVNIDGENTTFFK